jgi:hypothetical protein
LPDFQNRSRFYVCFEGARIFLTSVSQVFFKVLLHKDREYGVNRGTIARRV